MKKALIYGEFIEKSTTGIAYVNTNLKEALEEIGYKVNILHEPRSHQYLNNKKLIKRKINIFLFSKLIINIFKNKMNNISFITISMSNLGLIKTYLIQSLIQKKSLKLYLYIHRGDLDFHYKESFFKKIMIKIILINSFKIILLSDKFSNDLSLKNLKKKTFVIANSLSRKDYLISKEIYQRKITTIKKNTKKINFIFTGNIHKTKGIHNVINSIKKFNKQNKSFKIKLDIYGMPFEEINFNDQLINYKGKLESENRLEVMSKYDFLISASISEGLPITLIECMAIGLPFITTNVGAIEDLLIDNYPYICNFDSGSILSTVKKAVCNISKDQDIIKNLIRSNNEFFQKNFKFENYLSCVKKLLDN